MCVWGVRSAFGWGGDEGGVKEPYLCVCVYMRVSKNDFFFTCQDQSVRRYITFKGQHIHENASEITLLVTYFTFP